MAALEQTVLKDNTLLPGEWYGGQLHLFALMVGPDRHEIEIAQSAVR